MASPGQSRLRYYAYQVASSACTNYLLDYTGSRLVGDEGNLPRLLTFLNLDNKGNTSNFVVGLFTPPAGQDCLFVDTLVWGTSTTAALPHCGGLEL